jgi:hypothetical protein
MACIAVTTTNPRAALAEAQLVVERLTDLSPAAFASVLNPAR